MVLLSVDGRLLYITQPALNRVAVISTSTRQVQCFAAVPGRPSLLTIDPATNTLYAAGTASDHVTALDPATCAIKYVLKGNGSISGLAVALIGGSATGDSDNELWVASTGGLRLFHSNGQPLADIPLPVHPQYLCIPPGETAYVTTRQGEVEAIDLKTHRSSRPLLTGGVFGPMDYDAMTGEVYIPDLANRRIAILAPLTVSGAPLPREPLRTLFFPAAPQSVAITSDGQLGFVALADGNVTMLDIPGHQVVVTLQVGGHPSFIITGLYPLPLSLTPRQAALVNVLVNALHYAAAVIVLITGIAAVAFQKYREKRNRGKS
jgi:DNA-binding beta-propeller fold protein YncE